MTNSHRFKISPVSSSVPRHCHHRLIRFFVLFFFSHHLLVYFSLFLFSSIQDAVKCAIRGSMRDNAATSNVHRSALLIETGDLPKYRGIVEAGTHCEWHSAGPRGDGLFSWPGRREKWSGETNSRVTLFASSSSPSLKLGWWQCAKLESSHRCEIRRAW